MPKFYFRFLPILTLFLSSSVSAQTMLHPGDIAVVAIATNMAGCGLPAQSDEISFVCFQDIETGTTLEITDNGWETQFPGFWGDAEGTLSMTRTGGTITKGTVITLQAINNPGGWIYRTISPDNGWAIGNVNIPGGGPFNLDQGGEQVYFMQGGTWDNQGGGGINKSIYDGRVIFGFNTHWDWTANGSVNNSNLHPDVQPCYYFNQAPGTSYINFQKFADQPFSGLGHVGWLSLVNANTYWYVFQNCTEWNSFGIQYHSGYFMEVVNDMKMYCLACHGCQAPFQDGLKFDLPVGNYNVVYTDGTDTFEIQNIQNGYYFLFDVIVDMVFTLISVEEVDGCKVYSPFGPPAVIDNIGKDPGLYAELWLCPNFPGTINLFNYLNGTPETGGTWFSENPPGLGGNLPQGIITAQYGQGLFTYKLFHPHPPQPPPFPNWTCVPNYDSASVRIHFVDPSLSTLEVGCDQNGTPNDIFDDRITVTLNFLADTFITNYYVFVNGGGSVTPNSGVAGEPTVFYLDPGTAMGPNLQLTVQGQGPFNCNFKFPITSPGFCSDPCDYDMTSSVSGTEELCVKNCPENPGFFNVDVFGGTEPYKMGFSLFAPGHPAWNFPGIPIEQFNQIEVCIAEVPAPTFNPITNFLTIPQFLGGSELTFTLLEVTDKYDCTSLLTNDEHTITIHPLPVLNPTSFEVCKEFDRFFNLTDLDDYINAGLDIVWYEGDPLNGGDKIFFPTAVNLENISTLWAYTKDDHCENSIQIPFTILPSPKIDSIDALQVCYGSPVVLADIDVEDLGFSDPVYTFHPGAPFDLTNEIVPPSFIPSESTTIYVLATAGICFDTMPIEINVLDYPDFTLQGQPCNLIAGTYSILFSSTAASIISSAGVVFNNSSGPDSIVGIPNNVNVSIELLGAFNLCRDTFMIVAPNCNCPFIAPPVASQINVEICEGSPLPLLSVQNSPGLITNWYDVPSGGLPILQNNLSFQPVNPVNASYYVEAFDPASGCYSIRTQINLVINPVANLQALADPQLCASATIDFNSLSPGVLNGVSGVGQWFNLSTHLPVSGVIQPQNGNAWYYLFTSAQGICISSDTIQAIVHQSPVIDAFDIICNEALLTYDVSFTSDADIVVPSVGALSHIPGTDTFLLSNIPFDTNIQFDIQNSITGCTASISQLAPNCSCPALLQSSNTKLCSDQGVVDLSTFEGAGVNGSWQLVSTPPGSNPATLSGSNFQGQNADPGLYELRFIRSVILSDCVDTARFDLQLNESPFVDAGSNAVVCAPDVITLSGTAGGDNILFSWQENGAATISNPNALNTNYTPTLADITAGSVSFTLSAVDQTGFCPDASETIVMTIDDRAYFILNAPSQIYCDTADLEINFDDLISFGNTSGEWFFPDTVSAPIVGSSLFNPSTLAIGNYTVFYTTTNAVAPCKNDTVGVNLIIEDCACPSVALSLPTQGVCSEAAVQELNDFLLTSEQGNWSITGTPAGTKPAILNGTKFTTNNSDAGFYRLRFTLANPKAGCDDFAEINLEVIPTPTVQIVSAVCAGDLQSWEVIIISSAGSILNSQGILTDLGNDRYRIDGLTLLTSLQVSASNGNGLCTSNTTIAAPDCACTLNISNLPDEVSLCPNETITLEATVNGAKGTVTNFWILANDSLYQSSLVISTAGQYHFVSLDELGCRQEKFVDVLYYTEMVPDASVVDITCPGDQDGQIILHNIIGGIGPYFISINGGNMQPVSVFPHAITGLNAGNYKIDLLDGFSCSISFNLMVESVSAETLNLGPDQTILVGDSVQINPILSFTPDNFSWTGDLGVIDPLLLNQWIKPEVDQSYLLVAFDSKGCRYSDDLKIRVLLESSIYIPNVFSPNDDQINDLLAPLTDPSIIEIDYFEIFSRWGEMVYSEKKFPPNQPNFGWDGKLRGQHMMPGVFVYRISATNKKGKVIQQAGDITLLR